ncbi:amidase family protein [Streptomyces zhihengii]
MEWHLGAWLCLEHDLLDWETLRGEVDDDLIALMQEAERLTGVQKGNADAFRGGMWDAYTTFMQRYDLLVSPTVAEAAFPHSQFCPDWLTGESLQRRLLGWLLTYPYNMLTAPAITVPAGFTSDGRPVGLQIAGGLHADGAVIRAAANYESVRPWAARKPNPDRLSLLISGDITAHRRPQQDPGLEQRSAS